MREGPTTTPVLVSGALGALLWTALVVRVLDLGTSTALIAGASTLAGVGCSVLGAIWHVRHTADKTQVLERAEHDAAHDALTGLANRSALFEQLEETLRVSRTRGTTTGLLFLDLNKFKAINDSMGHEAGDELLRIVSDRLVAAVRGTDLVARFGGDEFVVIARDLLSQESVVAIAEQILKAFERPVSLMGGSQVVGTSIGVAIADPTEVCLADDLVRDADVAMYEAKRSGSGYAVFGEAQRERALQKRSIEQDLSAALSERQLLVFYQPIVDVSQRRLSGFEALVRWNHPDRGLVGPDEFLHVAAETGMMNEIGTFVLREAAAQAAVWNHLSPHAKHSKMSINIAEQQLLDSNFPTIVADVLAWAGLPADQLVLEVKEEIIVGHLEGISVLKRLKALGVNIAVDSFGVGRSSLAFVRKFDIVSTLKIDKTFVHKMDSDDSDRAVIEGVVAMARSLNLRVVGEGVEEMSQVRGLLDLGVNVMQGFLFNAPLAPQGIDPATWFPPRPAAEPGTSALTPLEVSRGYTASEPLADVVADEIQSVGGGATKSISSSTAPTSPGSRSA